MDYEFLRDITGVVKVRMSMDHEAIGHWFNEEVKGNLTLLDEVEQAARTVKGSERSWQRAGHEYTREGVAEQLTAVLPDPMFIKQRAQRRVRRLALEGNQQQQLPLQSTQQDRRLAAFKA